jgi:hypothetical protein
MCLIHFFHSYGDKAPKSVPARIIAVVWVLMSAVFLSLFTANATSILNQSLQGEDYSETFGKKVKTFFIARSL